MGVKARILTIRLLEKIRQNPAYAEKLGIEERSEHIWESSLDSDCLM